ncbi:hypothetical protein AB4143_05190 [Vibrio breoganii]
MKKLIIIALGVVPFVHASDTLNIASLSTCASASATVVLSETHSFSAWNNILNELSETISARTEYIGDYKTKEQIKHEAINVAKSMIKRESTDSRRAIKVLTDASEISINGLSCIDFMDKELGK